jgi:hypothetical protein
MFRTNIIYFTHKTNRVDFNYFFGDLLIVRTDFVKDVGVMLDIKLHSLILGFWTLSIVRNSTHHRQNPIESIKLHFHCHVDYLHFQALKLLGLIRFIAYNNFSSFDSLKVWYITLILLKFEYASVAENKLTLSHSNKLESIQRKFAKLCYNRFIQPTSYCNYESVLNYLDFKILYSRREYMDALFRIDVFKNKVDYCSFVDTVIRHVPANKIEDVSILNVSNVSRISASTGCITAAHICKSLDVFIKNNICLKHTQNWIELLLFYVCEQTTLKTYACTGE